MRLVMATANPDKALELAAILRDQLGGLVELLARPGGVEPVEETGETLEDNARLKALALVGATGHAAVADDTGLEVDALGGEPGTRTARFAGETATYSQNVAKLLEALEGETDRRARFRTVVVCRFPDGAEIVGEGAVEGDIATAPRGEGGFGYDPVFEPRGGGGRTFAEMSPDEKHHLSHRGLALRSLAAQLKRSPELATTDWRADRKTDCWPRGGELYAGPMAVLAGKGDSLDTVVEQVLSTRDRVVVEHGGVPAAVVVSAREMAALEYSIDLLSEPKMVRRILEGEAALQSGNLYMGEELAALDPDARFVLRSVTGGLNLAPSMRVSDDEWGLVASVPSRKALDELQFHVADAARNLIFGPLLADPGSCGVELHGFLARRLAARAETALVIYRLDSVKRLVRLVEVLNVGGLIGGRDHHHW
jgi:XTP/dITP diphosphohydrolase